MLTRFLASLAPCLAPALACAQDPADQLAPPVRLEAAGRPIDTEVGHAHPLVCDWDGDGRNDLLVGQFGGGKLWIYRNDGSNAAPALAAGTLFQDGQPHGTVPTG